jgi:hypothetical protein
VREYDALLARIDEASRALRSDPGRSS